jgi:hypothetical protein
LATLNGGLGRLVDWAGPDHLLKACTIEVAADVRRL